MTQIYETVLLMHPTLDDDGVETYQEQFSKIITDGGGEILHAQKWGKRRLQYPIARQTEAFYILICFKMDAKDGGAVVEEFERQVRINDELLREMTVKVKAAKVMDPPTEGIVFGRGGPRFGRGAPPSGRPPVERGKPPEVKEPAETEGKAKEGETPEAAKPEAAPESAPEESEAAPESAPEETEAAPESAPEESEAAPEESAEVPAEEAPAEEAPSAPETETDEKPKPEGE